jgi:hypothetical protein
LVGVHVEHHLDDNHWLCRRCARQLITAEQRALRLHPDNHSWDCRCFCRFLPWPSLRLVSARPSCRPDRCDSRSRNRTFDLGCYCRTNGLGSHLRRPSPSCLPQSQPVVSGRRHQKRIKKIPWFAGFGRWRWADEKCLQAVEPAPIADARPRAPSVPDRRFRRA